MSHFCSFGLTCLVSIYSPGHFKQSTCLVQNITSLGYHRCVGARPSKKQFDCYKVYVTQYNGNEGVLYNSGLQFNENPAVSYEDGKLLPPANEVWGKVIFLHLSVILFTGGCLVLGGAWSRGVPGSWGCLVRGCLVRGVPGPGGSGPGGAWS